MAIPRDPILYGAKKKILSDLYVPDAFYDLMGVDAPDDEEEAYAETSSDDEEAPRRAATIARRGHMHRRQKSA